MNAKNKIVAILLAAIMVSAVVWTIVPMAMANTNVAETGVDVANVGGSPPIIKCKWEQDKTPSLEDGDPTHVTYPGGPTDSLCHAQFLPTCLHKDVGDESNKHVEYWAIVTDPNGVGDIRHVYVDVYHPEGEPKYGKQKYQLELTEVPKGIRYSATGEIIGYEDGMGVDAYLDARDANLVTYGLGMTDAEVMAELDKCDAKVYMVQKYLSYHQPCGDYRVEIKSVDWNDNWAEPLVNCMTYVCQQCFEIDFNAVDFGEVKLCIEKWISGDIEWQTPLAPAPAPNPATVRNLGNMNMKLQVHQTDMDMGFIGQVPTEYCGSTPAGDASNWNVVFDARLGSDPANAMYFDPCVTCELPNKLYPCHHDELDLSIHVKKATPGHYTGMMTLSCNRADWDPGQTDGIDP